MRGDILSILEAAYAGGEEDAWLAGLLEAARPVMAPWIDVSVGFYERRPTGVEHRSMRGDGPTFEDAARMTPTLIDSITAMPSGANVLERLYPLGPAAGSFSHLSGLGAKWKSLPNLQGPLALVPSFARVADLFGVLGGNPSGHGVLLTGFVPEGQKRPSRDTIGVWTRVASHLAAAYRLRSVSAAPVEAVLDPGGRLQHVEGGIEKEERETLSGATKAIDRARGKLRRTDPDEALDVWKGLVAGRWTLMDQFDHDGRRYVVARRNAPRVRPWHRLNERERQVVHYAAEGQAHKLIAYTLGISVSAVARHLATAASKVGVTSRIALVAEYRRASSKPGAGA